MDTKITNEEEENTNLEETVGYHAINVDTLTGAF